jgi:hypothetical protein
MKASLATDGVKLNTDLCKCVGYAALNVNLLKTKLNLLYMYKESVRTAL